MTTAAMIGGMTPLALGLGEGGETQAPMGRAIIGGVITSTLLTLVVVPVLYTYLDAAWAERRKAAAAGWQRRPWRRRLTADRSCSCPAFLVRRRAPGGSARAGAVAPGLILVDCHN